ncbi:MAG: hypothetical protein HYX90_04850 [Chloroflexi bacterium]|nr:hypothetical protein [Chloroflexota bacterium]
MTKVGEVIGANTASFTGQCYELHHPPALGSLVKASDGEVDIYGLVSSAETRSLDEGRKPVARGMADSNEDIFQAHPQLARLLCTEFTAIVVGHQADNAVRQYLPPRPARIHSFINSCDKAEVRDFSASTGFLRMVVTDESPWIDEVISACLRLFSESHPAPESFLVAGSRELGILLGGDFHRLANIMRRVQGK